MDLSIPLKNYKLQLALDMTLAQLRAALGPAIHRESSEAETGATYFHLYEDGIEIVTEDGVFRYAFFEAPSGAVFQELLEQKGFFRASRTFPNAIDMLTPQVRLRYEVSDSAHLVVFDDGALAR